MSNRSRESRVLLLTALLAGLSLPVPARGAGKHAVLVGINAYPDITQLAGCVNDARNLQAVLSRRFGFSSEGIRVLTDGSATREGILGAVDSLGSTVGTGDLVVFFYSGHGTLFPDRLSEEQDETVDLPADERFGRPAGRYDSAICPFDTGGASHSGKPWENLILDDELFARFAAITARGATAVVFSDSCHSGSLGRELDASAKFVPVRKALRTPLESIRPPATARALLSREMPGAYLAFTSSSDTQVSWEHTDDQGRRCGLFTYALLEAIGRLDAGASYQQVFDAVGPQVSRLSSRRSSRQDPQMDVRFFRQGPASPFLATGPAPAAPAPATPEGLRVVVQVTDASGTPLEGSYFCVLKPGVRPAKGAIRADDTLLLGMTDAKGLFDSQRVSKRLPGGTYRLKVVRPGYQTFEGERVLAAGTQAGTAVLSFRLVSE